MHKLMEYICDELDELDRKAGKEGKLSMAEIEYADKLAHIKKSILTSEEMWDDSEYSMAGAGSGQSRMMGGGSSYRRGGGGGGSSRRGGGSSREGSSREGGGGSSREGGSSYEGGGGSSYARGRGRNARRDSMGRYSSEGYSMGGNEEMVQELREIMQDAPDEQTRMEFQRFIQKIEQM